MTDTAETRPSENGMEEWQRQTNERMAAPSEPTLWVTDAELIRRMGVR